MKASELLCPIEPLTNVVVVKRMQEETITAGGIIIPEVSREKPAKGVVIASGPGTLLPTGHIEPTGVEYGDTVLFGKYSGTEIEVFGERLLLIRAEHLLATESED